MTLSNRTQERINNEEVFSFTANQVDIADLAVATGMTNTVEDAAWAAAVALAVTESKLSPCLGAKIARTANAMQEELERSIDEAQR